MSTLRDRDEMAGMSDEKLALLAQAGSEDAFGLLVGRCAPMIQRQALRCRCDWFDTEDLVQEGFLGLLSAVRTFREDGGASFRTYAAVCIRRRMLTALRDSDKGRELSSFERDDGEKEEEALLSIPSGQADPAQLVVQREEMLRLQSRLRENLTQLEYQVLMLFLGAYTYEEIAQHLQLNTKAVDNALQRARRKLASVSFVDGSL